MTTKTTIKITAKGELLFAAEAFKGAKAAKAEAERQMEAARAIFMTHLKAVGMSKDVINDVTFQLIEAGMNVSYDKKSLELLVPEKVLAKCRKESPREEYVRVSVSGEGK